MAVIETENLTKYYGDTKGIDGLDLEVREGEVYGFLGSNGAGKTTTIRTLMGFQSPSSGTATVLGKSIGSGSELKHAREDIGYVPGEPGFDGNVTGRQMLDFYGSLRGDSRRDELLELFDPPLDRKIREYSRGNLQMLSIVVAFMHDPDLLLMDEPTAGLDPLKQERFYDFVRREKEEGKTFFLSSHILSEVRKICDRVGILREGKLVEVEEIHRLLNRSGKTVRFTAESEISGEEIDFEGVHDVKITGNEGSAGSTVTFTYTGGYNRLIDHLAGYSLRELDIEEAPLEEIFMRFYGDDDA